MSGGRAGPRQPGIRSTASADGGRLVTEGRTVMKDLGPDAEPVEPQGWQDAIGRDGPNRAAFLPDRAGRQARAAGATPPLSAAAPYPNAIPADDQPALPGDPERERRIRAINRRNAMATAVRRKEGSSECGGPIASFAPSAATNDVGLDHVWRARPEAHGGDLAFLEDHAAPGIDARPFLEGRIDEERPPSFRAEAGGKAPSPDPRSCLMPAGGKSRPSARASARRWRSPGRGS